MALREQTELIPGYRLLELLGQGGLGEVWKCEAPGGLIKALKIVRGGADIDLVGSGADREFQALQRVKALRHPFLLSLERIEIVEDQLVLVMELADGSLADRLAEHRAAGRAGIPRRELLGYLRETAEVLDLMSREHGLQHLDVKPRNLLLVGGHVKVADFGLVSSLALLAENERAARLESLTPLYASPECFCGRITPFSDQYSLAITYHELLTGALPFEGASYFQLALQHADAEPDLRRLPEADQPILARALAKNPAARFPSCSDFVKALAIAEGSRTEDRRARRSGAFPAKTRTSLLEQYRFLDCLTRTPVAEVWRALAPDGRRRLVKYVFNFGCPSTGGIEAPVDRLRALQHAGLVPTEVLEAPNRLVLLTDEWEDTLASRLKECQNEGRVGIPREELLGYLDEVAECLDTLYSEGGVAHLGLTPRHVVLDGGSARLTDFGLVALLWAPAGHFPGALNPRYSAPELFDGPANPTCDAYSLALIFQEMLTGHHAFRTLSQRATPGARLRAQPDLSLLSVADRRILTQALDADPSRRFATCRQLVNALAGRSPVVSVPEPSSVESVESLPLLAASTPLFHAPSRESKSIEQIIAELVNSTGESPQVQEFRNVRYVLRPGKAIEHRCFARLLAGTVGLKLEGFRQHWNAIPAASPGDAVSSVPTWLVPESQQSFVFHVLLPGSLWSRLLGQMPALEVAITLPRGYAETAALTEVFVQIRPVGCSSRKGAEALQDFGPLLLESLRHYLQPHPERRRQERLTFDQTVRVLPAFADEPCGEAILSQMLDVSTGGMKLFLPCRPPYQEVAVQVQGSSPDPLLLPARVVRVQACRDRRFEVGLSFLK
jgi:serine/threonine protein kinase